MFKWKTKKKRKVQSSQGNDDDEEDGMTKKMRWRPRMRCKKSSEGEDRHSLRFSHGMNSFHLQSHFHFSLVFTAFFHRDFNNEEEWKTSKIYNLKEQEKEFFSFHVVLICVERDLISSQPPLCLWLSCLLFQLHSSSLIPSSSCNDRHHRLLQSFSVLIIMISVKILAFSCKRMHERENLEDERRRWNREAANGRRRV